MTTILYPADHMKIKDTSNNSVIISSNKLELSNAGATSSFIEQDPSGNIILSSSLNTNSNNIYIGNITALPLAGYIGTTLPHTALSANGTAITSANTQCGYITLPSGVWAISATLSYNWTNGAQNFVYGALNQGSTFSTSTAIAISQTPKLATPALFSSSGVFNLTSFASSVAGTTVWLVGKCSNSSGGTCSLLNIGTTFMSAIRIA